MTEPDEMLDAIAADPGNDDAWHVLADWLLENGAPHAVLAAYDLQIDRGTNNAELIGDYGEARSERHRLPTFPGVELASVSWRCGYAVRATLRIHPHLGMRDREVRGDLEKLFSEPAMQALHQLIVEPGMMDMVRLEDVLAMALPTVPRRLRRLTVRTPAHGVFSPAALWNAKPPSAKRLDVSSRLFHGDDLHRLCNAGWTTLDLGGSSFLELGFVDAALRDFPNHLFILGGTNIKRAEALSFDRPNVRWVPEEADAALSDERGCVFPLVGSERTAVEWHRHALRRTLGGWELASGRVLSDGERFGVGDDTVEFHQRPGLDAWYRHWLRAPTA